MQGKNRFYCLTIVLFLFMLSGCSGVGTEKLLVWTFSKDVSDMVSDYRRLAGVDGSKLKIEVVYIQGSEYQARLEGALENGDGAPDVFALDAAYVKKIALTGLLADLSALKKSYAATAPFVLDAARNAKGKVAGLSWQMSPGGFFVRRSLAKKYLGTDDSASLQSLFADTGKFLETAALIKKKSGGRACTIASIDELSRVFIGGRKAGWVKDGRLVVDPAMIRLLEVCKLFMAEGYTAGYRQWSSEWFAGMRDELPGGGQAEEVFGYFLPSWGLRFALESNAPDTAGDWLMIRGPLPYFNGGTWLAARKGTRVKAEALDLIRFLCTDAAYLEQWAKDRRDLVSNLEVIKKTKGSFNDPYLGGQDYFSAFAEIALEVSGANLGAYDQDLEKLWADQQTSFLNGEKDTAKAVLDFRAAVKARFPKLITE